MSRHGREAKPRHGALRPQYGHWGPATLPAGACDMASRGLRHGAGSAHEKVPCASDTAGGHDLYTVVVPTTWPGMRAPRLAYTHLGGLVGPAGCALSAPSLFLDSVLVLSHFLDPVHEHCSSQTFFEKKINKIK